VLATWDIRSENKWKRVGADRHGVNQSERTVFNFIVSHTARKSHGQRRESFLLSRPIFSERMSQVAVQELIVNTTSWYSLLPQSVDAP